MDVRDLANLDLEAIISEEVNGDLVNCVARLEEDVVGDLFTALFVQEHGNTAFECYPAPRLQHKINSGRDICANHRALLVNGGRVVVTSVVTIG